MSALDLRTMIREVEDFPTPGVGFKDITPLLADPEGLKQTIGDALRLGSREAARRRSSARRRAASSSAPRSPPPAAAASCRRAARGSCRRRPSARATSSSTARTRSRCIPT